MKKILSTILCLIVATAIGRACGYYAGKRLGEERSDAVAVRTLSESRESVVQSIKDEIQQMHFPMPISPGLVVTSVSLEKEGASYVYLFNLKATQLGKHELSDADLNVWKSSAYQSICRDKNLKDVMNAKVINGYKYVLYDKNDSFRYTFRLNPDSCK